MRRQPTAFATRPLSVQIAQLARGSSYLPIAAGQQTTDRARSLPRRFRHRTQGPGVRFYPAKSPSAGVARAP